MSLTVPDIPTDLTVKVLREQLGVYDAKEEELRHFARVCAALNLSPFAGQICLIGRRDRRAGRIVYRPQITVDGRRARAERTGLLDGIEGPVWCGPRTETGELAWREVWDDDDNYPYCARVLVWRKDWSRPSNGTAKWSEMAQYVPDGNGQKLSPFWYRMPSHMLGKVAESLALRRAFPNDDSYRLAASGRGDEAEAALVEVAAQALPASDDDAVPAEVVQRAKDAYDRVPDHVRDDQPEAYDQGPERYDPADASRPFV